MELERFGQVTEREVPHVDRRRSRRIAIDHRLHIRQEARADVVLRLDTEKPELPRIDAVHQEEAREHH